MLDSTHLRFFTKETLERMFERCGWRVVARDDFEAVRTDQYDEELNDNLPLEMVGALRTMANTLNPDTAVQQFVWALKPFPVANPPESFLQAVAPGTTTTIVPAAEAEVDIRRYLDQRRPPGQRAEPARRPRAAPAPGRRAAPQLLSDAQLEAQLRTRWTPRTSPTTCPLWKQWALDTVYQSPRSSAAFQKLYRRLR